MTMRIERSEVSARPAKGFQQHQKPRERHGTASLLGARGPADTLNLGCRLPGLSFYATGLWSFVTAVFGH